MNYANLYNPNVTQQTEPMNERQVKNNAGGYVFAIDAWGRLERFLILGSDAPTYYQSARKLTAENAKVVIECWRNDPIRTMGVIRDVVAAGRAPRNDPAIFAIALGSMQESVAARQAALSIVKEVCRTGTHLFQFVATAKSLGRGFGRAMKRAVADWYNDRPGGALAYQLIKYRSRDSLTHENVLDMARPKPADEAHRLLYKWAVGKASSDDELPPLIRAHEQAMNTTTAAQLLPIIRQHKLPWEAIPTWALSDPDIWKALLPGLGLTAIVRNLGNMTRIGAITPLSQAEELITTRLKLDDEIKESRIHPMQVLTSLAIYARGHGVAHGDKTPYSWTPNQRIVDALDGAFYKAFGNVEPSGKRTLIALDVSGSMSGAVLPSCGHLSARAASAAMSLMTMSVEPSFHVVGFSRNLMDLAISPKMRINDVVRYTDGLPFDGTDCSLPIVRAMDRGWEVETFVIYTDNETWAGRIHPMQALHEYRRKTNIPAKLIVVGMTSTGFSIADPADDGALDVVGFDTSAPAVMADFARR